MILGWLPLAQLSLARVMVNTINCTDAIFAGLVYGTMAQNKHRTSGLLKVWMH